jgi:hypothetical protein
VQVVRGHRDAKWAGAAVAIGKVDGFISKQLGMSNLLDEVRRILA